MISGQGVFHTLSHRFRDGFDMRVLFRNCSHARGLRFI